jgi:hypothetical protein
MIANLLCDEDLCNLTRVSRYMAASTSAKYLCRKGLTLSPRGYSLVVRDEGFSALNVWRRTSGTSKVPALHCYFGSDTCQMALQMLWLQRFFMSLSQRPSTVFDHIYLAEVKTPKLQQCLDLLGNAAMTGCRAITMTEVTIQDSRTGWKKKKDAIILKGLRLEELNFEYCQLTSSQWTNLLWKLVIPSLRMLKIMGETSMGAVYDFLLHNPGIRYIHFQKCSTTDIPSSSRRLELPKLQSLQGSSSQILNLLKCLSSPPSLRKLVVETNRHATSKPYNFVDQVMHCLSLCKGSLALEISLSKYRSVAGLMLDITRVCTARGLFDAALPCIISTLCIEFEGINDEWVFVRDIGTTELVYALIVSR